MSVLKPFGISYLFESKPFFRVTTNHIFKELSERETSMFLVIAVLLVLAWLGGFTLMHVSGFLIHLLLIFAVIAVIAHFLIGGRRA